MIRFKREICLLSTIMLLSMLVMELKRPLRTTEIPTPVLNDSPGASEPATDQAWTDHRHVRQSDSSQPGPGPSADAGNDEQIVDTDAEAATLDGTLAWLDELRAVPGAAPLLDDVLQYLQNEGADDFDVSRLPVDGNGLAVLDDESMDHLIRDPEIRAKFQMLMKLTLKNAEIAGTR